MQLRILGDWAGPIRAEAHMWVAFTWQLSLRKGCLRDRAGGILGPSLWGFFGWPRCQQPDVPGLQAENLPTNFPPSSGLPSFCSIATRALFPKCGSDQVILFLSVLWCLHTDFRIKPSPYNTSSLLSRTSPPTVPTQQGTHLSPNSPFTSVPPYLTHTLPLHTTFCPIFPGKDTLL